MDDTPPKLERPEDEKAIVIEDEPVKETKKVRQELDFRGIDSSIRVLKRRKMDSLQNTLDGISCWLSITRYPYPSEVRCCAHGGQVSSDQDLLIALNSKYGNGLFYDSKGSVHVNVKSLVEKFKEVDNK
jgi:hypothetical protein